MKLATFTRNGVTRLGKIDGDTMIDLAIASPQAPLTMLELFRGGKPAIEAIQQLSPTQESIYPLSECHLEAPISNPTKYLAIGLNFTDHAAEAAKAGIKIPDTQVWFNKQVSCITGPTDPIHMPRVSNQLDYEAELGVVIGTKCRHVSVADAKDMIGGYFVLNDVTVRDWQHRTPQWTLGKSFDTHGPIGPWIVTADEIADPHQLKLKLWVNDEIRQDCSTNLMIRNIYEQISYLSTVMTLEPGDILATGTGSGVGISFQPPRYLKEGDVVRVEIENVGEISNTVIAEPSMHG